jgi:hypothetical protein
MHDHLVSWGVGLITGIVAALATRVQLLPDVIDLSVIPTGAGFGSLLGCAVGAALRFEPDRLGRVALLGTLFGGGITSLLLLLGLIL